MQEMLVNGGVQAHQESGTELLTQELPSLEQCVAPALMRKWTWTNLFQPLCPRCFTPMLAHILGTRKKKITTLVDAWNSGLFSHWNISCCLWLFPLLILDRLHGMEMHTTCYFSASTLQSSRDTKTTPNRVTWPKQFCRTYWTLC